jgi:hypothetical protein
VPSALNAGSMTDKRTADECDGRGQKVVRPRRRVIVGCVAGAVQATRGIGYGEYYSLSDTGPT